MGLDHQAGAWGWQARRQHEIPFPPKALRFPNASGKGPGDGVGSPDFRTQSQSRQMRSPSLMLRDTSPVRRGIEGAQGWGMGLDRQAGRWGWIARLPDAIPIPPNALPFPDASGKGLGDGVGSPGWGMGLDHQDGGWGWITKPGDGVGSPGRGMGLASQTSV